MTHIFQQLRVQNPDFDVFSADAIKAFYSLIRGLALRKLKEEVPEAFKIFMNKRDNSSNAFSFGLVQG